jgi:DNA polymerase III delta subunit
VADYGGLLRSLDRGEVPALLLIHGPDRQLLDDALAAVSTALFPDPSLAVFDREVLDAAETDADAIVRSALTLPLQAARRLIAVRRAQALAVHGREVLTAYAGDPSPTSCVLLLADESLTASRERRADHWLLAAVPRDRIVGLGPRPDRALEDWLRQRAAAEHLSVSAEAAHLLVEWVGGDSALLLAEARKAALAGGPDNRAVGVNEVTAVVGEHRVRDAFEISNSVERRDLPQALKVLDRLLATEPPVFIVTLLTREARTAWSIHAGLARGQRVDDIARAVRRPPRVVQGLVAAVAGETAATSAWRLRRCWEVERALKSGGQPRAELTALVVDLCRSAGVAVPADRA